MEAGCLCQLFFLILPTSLPAPVLFGYGYASTSKPLMNHPVFYLLEGDADETPQCSPNVY
jgi:hypothetical protein